MEKFMIKLYYGSKDAVFVLKFQRLKKKQILENLIIVKNKKYFADFFY